MMAKHQKRQKMNFIRRLLVKNNHLTRALCMSGICRQSVRTGSKPVGVLKRVIRFKSCEKPNDQPVYLTVPVGLLDRFYAAIFISGSSSFMTRPFPASVRLLRAGAGFF